jgi:AAA+ ATPase superfamily predicted ATPase
MLFLNRRAELARLAALARRTEGGFAVLYGRRRVGKTRLLLEWTRDTQGVYVVSDQSAPALQRRYLAGALAELLPGFADVEYPDWSSLLTRLAREAGRVGWRGPLVLDELPYLVLPSPELPSVLQRWIDHDARAAKLVVAIAGSSQHMMQGLALAANAPLFGRAQELLEIEPLLPGCVGEAGVKPGLPAAEFYAAWGGIPRYWELALERGPRTLENIADLVMDPLGPLHREPDRLLVEEIPSAIDLRPILDAIASGVHRLSEIAGRMGRPATSLGKPLQRLTELGLVRRELPFGTSDDRSKRSLYRIADPFLRLWFGIVAPHRSRLVRSTNEERRAFLEERWDRIAAETWEELCRAQLPSLGRTEALGDHGQWQAGQRWWHGSNPEWDVVSLSSRGRVLLGEAKWSRQPFSLSELTRLARTLRSKPHPELPAREQAAAKVFVLFVPEAHRSVPAELEGVRVVTARDLFLS